MPPPDLAALLLSWELALRAERKSPATVKAYGDAVRWLLAWCVSEPRPAVLDRPTVNGFVVGLLDGGAEAATARARHLALRRFGAWLVEEGEVEVDAVRDTRPPTLDVKTVDPLTEAEVAALVRACREGSPDFRDRRDSAVVRLMVETGMRAGEVVGLTVADLDLDLAGGTVLVRRGKGGKARRVPVGAQTTRALDRYLRTRRSHRLAETEALWLGDRGTRWTYDALHTSLAEQAAAAGVDGFRPHRLRHTAAHTDGWPPVAPRAG